VEADQLHHVVDSATPAREAQKDEVENVLQEIGAGGVPQQLVFNKADLLDAVPAAAEGLHATIPRVFMSAATGQGIDALRTAIAQQVRLARSQASDAGEQVPSDRQFDQPAAPIAL
ncbi:MAG: GTPase HflX, partial [Betaproteobacteria bacterium]